MKRCNTRRRAGKSLALVVVAVVGVVGLSGGQVWGKHGITSSCISKTNCPKEDVVNTKHNLAHNLDVQSVGTTEICVFCHTPHGGNITMPGTAPSGTAPLWNRLLPGATYQTYDSPNFDNSSTNAQANQPKGVSLACLSCHDGTIAIDALINAPGSGGYIAANIGTGSRGTRVGYTFNGPLIDPTDGTMTEDKTVKLAEAPANRPPVPFPNLGTDLRDDHPIGIQVPVTDPQFKRIRDDAPNNLDGGVVGTSVWYLKGKKSTELSFDKRDRVRLYPSTGKANEMFVECASCHNPHTPRPVFLRLPQLPTGGMADPTDPNEQSALCLTCHDK